MLDHELQRIQNLLHIGDCTEKQWCELYTAQQSLLWVKDQSSVKSPFNTIMQGLVISPQEWNKPFMEDIPAKKEDCLSQLSPV